MGLAVAASARPSEALEALAEASNRVTAIPVDVVDPAAMATAVESIESQLGPIDLAILSAGIWQPMSAKDYVGATAHAAMAVNYGGVVNALDALLPRMIARKSGHIVLFASISGYRGFPRGAACAPSKAAVISLAESLKLSLEPLGISISVVNTGFVDTPSSRSNPFPMPFMLTAEAAAARIIRGIERRRFEIAFPWRMILLVKLARLLPYRLYFWLLRQSIMRL